MKNKQIHKRTNKYKLNQRISVTIKDKKYWFNPDEMNFRINYFNNLHNGK